MKTAPPVLVRLLLGVLCIGVLGWRIAVNWTPEYGTPQILRGMVPSGLPPAELDAAFTAYPLPGDYESDRLMAVESEMRGACYKEHGDFFWSGEENSTMRCWHRKGEVPSTGDSLIFEVDP